MKHACAQLVNIKNILEIKYMKILFIFTAYDFIDMKLRFQ